jgi:proteic killer suppression protein
MIRTFADDETETIWNGKRSRKLPPDIQDRALVRLRMLSRAETLDDLRNPPSRRGSFWRERSAGVGLD